ncbi:hypothetical protein IE81DRAFT_102937 [Ceraceosorus guamensis]|uniref:RRM domain-containing protein n=1 Tax=Ceraceosorus guamensis TaxID=1522189 RepID=A0A316W057_9BASI|nr:hypothetical protein IE81DRAFT_102937 [Ceraceosorus guamensis]PWN43069.1 hypothetical protein IE81DRAFT_102937 [Ceraceosorus guamensis]
MCLVATRRAFPQYDSRQATAAMNGLQGLQLNGRPISIHYCLPKEAERVAACDRDKNQGTLLLLLQNPQQSIQDAAVAATFGEFGDIKRLLRIHKLPDGRPPDAFLQANARYLEFFDSRAAQLAYDRMQNQLWQGGQWDLSFVWDWHLPQDDAPSLPPPSQGPLAPAGYNNQYGQSAPSQANRSAGSGVSPGGPQSHGPPASGGLSANQVETPMRRWGAGGNAGSSNDAGPAQAPHPGPGSYAAPSASGGQGGWAARPPAPNNQSYAATGNASPYGTAPPSGQSNDPGRLDQAQKVQQLLASLKGAGNSTPPQHSHSPQPGAGQAQQAPSATAAKPAASPAPTPGLPAGLAALLKQAGGGLQQNPPAQPAQPAQGQTNSAQSMQQLLAMLKPAGGQR